MLTDLPEAPFMNLKNSDLRSELERLTTPTCNDLDEWVGKQVDEIEKLRQRIPHSVRLYQRWSLSIHELNCFMFALDIHPDAVRDKCSNKVFPGSSFTKSLLRDGFLHQRSQLTKAEDGAVILYFTGDEPKHAGKINAGAVISKWGSGGTSIWRHALWDIPTSYGEEMRLYTPQSDIEEKYRRWATENGL